MFDCCLYNLVVVYYIYKYLKSSWNFEFKINYLWLQHINFNNRYLHKLHLFCKKFLIKIKCKKNIFFKNRKTRLPRDLNSRRKAWNKTALSLKLPQDHDDGELKLCSIFCENINKSYSSEKKTYIKTNNNNGTCEM